MRIGVQHLNWGEPVADRDLMGTPRTCELRYRLLFVGVDEGGGCTPLRSAARDARAVANWFASWGYSREGRRTLLTNSDATFSAVSSELHQITCESDLDLLLIYWSGHMGQHNNQYYLVTADECDLRSPQQGFPLELLTAPLRLVPRVKNRVMILDTCHAGAAAAHLEGLRRYVHEGERLVMFAACAPEAYAREDSTHGLFTASLLTQLRLAPHRTKQRNAPDVDLVSSFLSAAEAVAHCYEQAPFVALHGLGTPFRLPTIQQQALPFE